MFGENINPGNQTIINLWKNSIGVVMPIDHEIAVQIIINTQPIVYKK